jgi:hypothetical protein
VESAAEMHINKNVFFMMVLLIKYYLLCQYVFVIPQP